MLPDANYVLEMRNISKSFGSIHALANVDIELGHGEVLCIAGENGAGKSTLIKIMCGAHKRDQGSMMLEGRPVAFEQPIEAIRAGINTIHQELSYLSELSVAENIYLGRQPIKAHSMRVDWKKMRENCRRDLAAVGLETDPNSLMKDLSMAEKQLVEIAKAISFNSKIIIMDEPTSSLGIEETNTLLNLIKTLADRGISIIYISHRLDEIIRIADRIVVLRDGMRVGELTGDAITKPNMVNLMVGRELSGVIDRKNYKTDEVGLEVRNLNTAYLKNINFKAYRGEILGLFGMVGSGRTELVETIFGVNKKPDAQILIGGKEAIISNPTDAIRSGLSYVSAERKRNGLILIQSIAQNIAIVVLDKIFKHGILDAKMQTAICDKWIKRLSIKTTDGELPVSSLSGGNQQKVVIAKWLQSEPQVLILNEPTRGIDVAAKAEVYKIMEELCSKGMCIIAIASEMAEILSISDRIITFCEGRITAEFMVEDATQEKLMQASIEGGKYEI